MTFSEARDLFLNRGYVEVKGGTIYDADKWRELCRIIPEWLEQEPCGDAISRQAVMDYIHRILNQGTGKKKSFKFIQKYVEKLPSVKPQESSITWVTGADGAKIAFKDVPVWKVTKICEILGEPQERSEE